MPLPADRIPSGSSRALPRWLLLLAAAFLVARIATGIWENQNPPAAIERVSWQSIATAPMAALASRKPILYDFAAEWCAPCKIMNREVFADEASAQMINTMFHPVRVLDRQAEEGRNPPEVAELQARYRIEAFPTLVVVPTDGREPTVIQGYSGKQDLMQKLMRAARQGKPQ